jgi:simple sugar transport system permease protein
MHDLIAQLLQVGFFAALIRIATPLIFATLGELLAERSGVVNLGVEGIMLFSAMTGFTAAFYSGDLWIGIASAAATGAAMGLLMGLLTVTLGLSQHVSGLGVTMLCTGFAFYFYRLIFGTSQPPSVTPFHPAHPFARRHPVIGPVYQPVRPQLSGFRGGGGGGIGEAHGASACARWRIPARRMPRE